MKKIIILSILLISTHCYSVDLDNAYRNAKLNVDYSSSIVFNDKEIVKEDELAQWILSNSDNFANINQIKIDFGTKWYWGSWKRVVRALEFVKKENVQNRLAYFENLRKNNEKNRSWSWQEIAQGLLESYNNNSDFKAIVDYSAKKVKEGVESFKDSWKNASSESYSNESYSNNSNQDTENDYSKKNENLDGNQKLKNSESATIDKEKYRTGNFELLNYTEEVAYSEKYVTKIFIKFNDDISFAIYYSPECGKYYHNETIGIKSYFKDKISLIKSMYAYKKGGFNSIYNFGNSSTCD